MENNDIAQLVSMGCEIRGKYRMLYPGDIVYSSTPLPETNARFNFIADAVSATHGSQAIYTIIGISGRKAVVPASRLHYTTVLKLPVSSYPCMRVAKEFDIPLWASYGFMEYLTRVYEGSEPNPTHLAAIKAVGDRTSNDSFLAIWTYFISYWYNANRKGYFYARDVG